MKEQKISFETAKLVKDAKILLNNIGNLYYYDATGEFLMNRNLAINVGLNNCYLAPTQSILQKTLRDKFKLHITIEYGFFSFNKFYNYNFCIEDINVKNFPEKFRKIDGSELYKEAFTSFEKCLEAALQEALKLIK